MRVQRQVRGNARLEVKRPASRLLGVPTAERIPTSAGIGGLAYTFSGFDSLYIVLGVASIVQIKCDGVGAIWYSFRCLEFSIA